MSIGYILSTPRSGSTLFSVLLNQHPEIHCPAEPWFMLAAQSLGDVYPEHPADSVLMHTAVAAFLGADSNRMRATAAKAVYEQRLREVGKKIFIDKTPRNFHCLDVIDMVPDARKIVLLRNPLDVAASYKDTWEVDIPAILSARAKSPFYLDYVMGFRRLADLLLQQDIMVVRYEALVSDPTAVMNAVFKYLGVDPIKITKETRLELNHLGASSLGDKKIINTSTLHSKSVDRWKEIFDPADVATLVNSLGRRGFESLGYANEYLSALEYSRAPEDDSAAELAYEKAQEIQRDGVLASKSAAEFKALYQEALDEADRVQSTLKATRQELEATRSLLRPRNYLEHIATVALTRLNTRKKYSAIGRISVVTPCYNCVEFIEQAVVSVLDQDYLDIEYIIVDGGSTDGTLDVIRSILGRDAYRDRNVRLVTGRDKGMYDALSKGFSMATGDIFCYLNADDTFEPGALRGVGQHFARYPDQKVIYHSDHVLFENWKFCNLDQPKRVGTADLLGGHILFQDGVFWRSSAYRAVGGFRSDFKLAGDFDFWLRLSAQYKFHHRKGRVSCFRLRPGQLSNDMISYAREQETAIHDFLAGVSSLKRGIWKVHQLIRKLSKKIARFQSSDAFYYPIDFQNMPPPPGILPDRADVGPTNPIDGSSLSRFLFCSPDTRFGEDVLTYVYLDDDAKVAVAHPKIKLEYLDGLYERNYSSPPVELKKGGENSPYRGFGRSNIVRRAVVHLPLHRLSRFFPNLWADNTLPEFESVLVSAGVRLNVGARILDAGCFEGALLDRIAKETGWKGYGLEPNPKAAAIAEAKGHKVWNCHVEDAPNVIDAGLQFDVIFLGQTIEHVDNPLQVLRRLRLLLAPDGVIVMSTPNLNSAEVKWFGPTWAHWHLPYHRHIFSRDGLYSLAKQAGLRALSSRTFSNAYWTCMSLMLNEEGLGGAVSHEVDVPSHVAQNAIKISVAKKVLHDRFGRGDYIYVVMREY
ncbi:glycosyltransferase [Rhizobium sp. AAP43]|uniref:glycosyltransferase n=1 Tax=Rhizobium sp. AAP43 TaxID=1523420 RepID=UPI0006B96624|nr:glycosyltransferase [Rhizobium sp. AAP43]KPF46849.1 hypothetical protein IP76_02945 [Rhizobium sp. AAP43]